MSERDKMGILNNRDHYVAPYLKSERDRVWHPLSELPTEEDGDADGEVILWMGEGVVDIISYRAIRENWQEPWYEESDRWARCRDVILFPTGDK